MFEIDQSSVEPISVTLWIGIDALDEQRVLKTVEVCLLAVECDAYIVTTFVVIIGAVQRLVQVGHEVHDELQGFVLSPWSGSVIPQHCDKAVDRGGNTIAISTIPGGVNR